MWWLARRLGLSRRAALLAACVFMMSTWYSLHLATGHTNFWPAAYMPWALGCLWLAGRDLRWALGAAAWLALAIFEGGNYVYLLFLALVGPMAAAWTIQSRSWRPLAGLALMVAFSAGLGAVRLAPETALMARYPRPTVAGGTTYEQLKQDVRTGEAAPAVTGEVDKAQAASTEPTMRWSGPKALLAQLAKIFFGREQHVEKYYFRYQGYGWHEYGAYIGPGVSCFWLAYRVSPRAARAARRRGPARRPEVWPRFWGAAGCFLIAVGNFAPFSPWGLLHHLPVYDASRVSSRYLIPCVLCLAVAAGWSFDRLWVRFAAAGPRAALLALLVLACADLVYVGGSSFHNEDEFKIVAVPPVSSSVTTVFGGKAQQTVLMMSNHRTRNGYDPIPISCGPPPRGTRIIAGSFITYRSSRRRRPH